MRVPTDLHQEVNALKTDKEDELLETRLLNAYAELKASRTEEGLEYVVFELAHFYSRPRTENPEKAEAFFLERERLAPGARAKRATAQFYFFLREPHKVIAKVDEIVSQQSDRASYYSALTLKGQALLDIQNLDDVKRVVDELVNMARMNPQGLPYGDEMNLMEAAVVIAPLRPKCCELLGLVVPKIKDQEYRERGDELLKSSRRRKNRCRCPIGQPRRRIR